MSPIVKAATEQGITGEVIAGKVKPLANEIAGYKNGIKYRKKASRSYLRERSKVV